MEKLFVPYEIAVLAKEKGFKEKCFASFCIVDVEPKFMLNDELDELDRIYGIGDNLITNAPLYQQLIDWLSRNKIVYLYNPTKDLETINKEIIECLTKLESTK